MVDQYYRQSNILKTSSGSDTGIILPDIRLPTLESLAYPVRIVRCIVCVRWLYCPLTVSDKPTWNQALTPGQLRHATACLTLLGRRLVSSSNLKSLRRAE